MNPQIEGRQFLLSFFSPHEFLAFILGRISDSQRGCDSKTVDNHCLTESRSVSHLSWGIEFLSVLNFALFHLLSSVVIFLKFCFEKSQYVFFLQK